MPASNFLQKLFLPKIYAVILPIALIVVGVAGITLHLYRATHKPPQPQSQPKRETAKTTTS